MQNRDGNSIAPYGFLSTSKVSECNGQVGSPAEMPAQGGNSSNAERTKDHDVFVFRNNERVYYYARKSLFFISAENPARQRALDIIHHKYFDSIILGFIVLNSLLIAMVDWENIDMDPESTTYGEPIPKGSWQNTLIQWMEWVFMVVFTLEMVLKIGAMGFTGGRDTYIKSPWNKLDFVVVITSLPWTNLISGMPNVSILRTFRILRPLRTLSSIPELQKIVRTMLVSLPDLANVILILCFIFALFGILGMQLFSGRQHFRCRLTPFPVTSEWTSADDPYDYAKYACLLGSDEGRAGLLGADESTTSVKRLMKYNFNILGTDDTPRKRSGDWEKHDSPWARPLDCFWPFDESDAQRICDPTESGYPQYQCYHSTKRLHYTDWRWCGSNYDARGNSRFIGPQTINGVKYSTDELMALPTFNEALSFGFMNFDNFASAFLTVFQCITMEGWVYISYQLMDGWSAVGAAIFFSVLIIFGAFFVLNLLLAVMESNFHMDDERTNDSESLSIRESGEWNNIYADEENPQNAESELKKDERRPKVRSSWLQENWKTAVDTWEKSENRRYLLRVVSHEKFQGFITSLIIFNTITLAMDHHPMDPTLAVVLEGINFALTILFGLEMFLKLYAMGCYEYQKDIFNRFDGFIVIVSLIELGVFPPAFRVVEEEGSGFGGAILGLRSFRLFRIFKLARRWVSMRKLLLKIAVTCVDIGYFGLLLGLFMFIFSLIGCQFFANRLHFDENGYVVPIGMTVEYEDAYIPRSNFDNLLLSFTTVFQILSAEGWNLVMYDCRRATSWVSSLYFVALIVGGLFMIMNLFIAILLGNFCNDESNIEEPSQEASSILLKDAGTQRIGSDKVVPVIDAKATIKTDLSTDEGLAPRLKLEIAPEVKGSILSDTLGDSALKSPDDSDNDTATSETTSATPVDTSNDEIFPLAPGRILFLFDENSRLRTFCAKTIAHPLFDQTVLILIVISSFFLALDDPLLSPDSEQAIFLKYSDYVMTILFTFEMLFKILAIGFLWHPGAYLQSSWNQLDFIVVLISIITIFGEERLRALRTLRALRALRPLRVVKRAPGLRIVVNAMFKAIPDVLNVVAVCCLFFLIFSILGVTFFKGQLRACQGETFDTLEEYYPRVLSLVENPKPWNKMDRDEKSWFLPGSELTVFDGSCSSNANRPCCEGWPNDKIAPTSKQICQCLNMKWDMVVPQTFDNTAKAFLTFFEISTTEGWVEVMYAAVDISGIDMQPIRDNNLHWVWFFMIFIMVGGYLVLNLFVGVVVDNFNSVRKNAEGDVSLLTEEQQAWIKTQQMAAKMKPKIKLFPPRNKLGKLAFEWVVNDHKKKQLFEAFIMSCIVLNTIVMAMSYFGQGQHYETALENINYVFAGIFTIEAIIKILGLKVHYFYDNWNVFDFAIVVGTIIGIILLLAANVGLGSVTTLVRTFRVGRILRLIQGAKSLRRLFNTLILTLPGLSNISCLLFLLIFIFTVMGTSLFAKVGFHKDHNENANFRTFWHGVLTLIRFSTGENWNGMMHSLANNHNSKCVQEPIYNGDMCGFNDRAGCEPMNGCGTWLAYPYMILFNLVVAFVFINLFIGVILEGFDLANEDIKGVTEDEFQLFSEHWAEFDHKASFSMPEEDLKVFVATLCKPFGLALEHHIVHYGQIPMNKDAENATEQELKDWEENFSELRKHKEVHGNCNVIPNSTNAALAVWVSEQRKEWKKFQVKGLSKSRLNEDQITRLDNLGLRWEGVIIMNEGRQENDPLVLRKVENLALKPDKYGNVSFKDVLAGLAEQTLEERDGIDRSVIAKSDAKILGRAAKGLKEIGSRKGGGRSAKD